MPSSKFFPKHFCCFPLFIILCLSATYSFANFSILLDRGPKNNRLYFAGTDLSTDYKRLPILLSTQSPETHTLSATYYRIDSNFESVLMVSNQGPNPMPVQVILFSLSGEEFDLPLVILGHQEVKAFNLRNYLQSPNFQEGSLQVTYQGRKLELGGVLQVSDSRHSLMLDEELSETKYFASTKLEGVWWTNFTDADWKLAISNTTADPTAATLNVEGVSPKQQNAQTIYLQPHQTRVLSISEIAGGQTANFKKAGAVSITYNGLAGGILAHGMISKADAGYSSVIEFIDPAKQKTTSIDGVGLRFGKVNGQRLVQDIVAHNAGTAPVKINGYLSYTTDNDTGEAAIPETWLGPGEVREINVPALLASRSDIVASGLHFQHDGQPGQVIIAASSVSQDGNNVFRVPFKDAKLASSTGSYPYSLDGDSRAIVYLQNVTSEPKKYTLEIDYDGGSYVLGVKDLPAKHAIAYDIRRIRDEQVPDSLGHVIPLNVTSGKAFWSIHGSGDRAIIGRIEQANLVTGMSGTSSCGRCCPDSIADGFLLPGSVSGFPGDTTTFIAMQQDVDCFDNPRTPYQVSGFGFFSSDTSVATINSSTGFATGVAPGNTLISSDIVGDVYTSCGGETGNDEYCCDSEPLVVHCESSCEIKPAVSSISASIPSTINPIATPTPADGTYSTANVSATYATESTIDMVVFQSSQAINVSVGCVNPTNCGSMLKWTIERDTGSGLPTLSATSGTAITVTPTISGNFRLICYFDANNNNAYNAGEELRVLLFAVIKVSSVTDCIIGNGSTGFIGVTPDPSDSTSFGVTTNNNPMNLECSIDVEGGGSNKRIGTSKIHFGDVGNLTADNASVIYATSGTAVEYPLGSSTITFPIIDSPDDPTMGDEVFRANSEAPSSDLSLGKEFVLTSFDAPGFGPYKIVNPNSNTTWASTNGGYNFTEYIAGFSDTFKHTYVVVAKATWTISFNGTRNSSDGSWTNNGSSITLQGGNNTQTNADCTITVTDGTPQSGTATGIQVLGKSYVVHKSAHYNP